ncbi:MAG: anti-sigma factor family protein [Desulfobaccales bacterium]
MRCHEVQEYLSAFLDGEAPTELEPRLAEHLADCPACRAELQTLERLEAAFDDLEVPEPRDLAAKVGRRLPRPASPWRHTLALAACLVVGIFLGGFLSGTLYPWPADTNGNGTEIAGLEILQDYPQGSLGGAFFYLGEEENGA